MAQSNSQKPNDINSNLDKIQTLIWKDKRRKIKHWILIGSSIYLMFLSAIVVILFFFNFPKLNNDNLFNKAKDVPINLKNEILKEFNTLRTKKNIRFRLPSNNKDGYFDLDEANKYLNSLFLSNEFVNDVQNNPNLKSEIEKIVKDGGFNFLGVINNKIIIANNKGLRFDLLVRVLNLKSNYDKDLYGKHNNYGYVELNNNNQQLTATSKFVIGFAGQTLNSSLRIANLRQYFKDELSWTYENPNVLMLNLDNLEFLQNSNQFVSNTWQGRMAQTLYNSFYQFKFAHLRFSDTNFFTNSISSIVVEYDNRYYNANKDLNKNLIQVKKGSQDELNYTNKVLSKFITNFKPLSFENVNTQTVTDNYSGYAPNNPNTDNKTNWDSKKINFTGGVRLIFENFKYTRNFEYTNLSYENNNKEIKLPDFQLGSLANDLLNKTTFNTNPSQADFNNDFAKVQAIYNSWYNNLKPLLKNNVLGLLNNGFSAQNNLVRIKSAYSPPTKTDNVCTYKEFVQVSINLDILVRINDYSGILYQSASKESGYELIKKVNVEPGEACPAYPPSLNHINQINNNLFGLTHNYLINYYKIK